MGDGSYAEGEMVNVTITPEDMAFAIAVCPTAECIPCICRSDAPVAKSLADHHPSPRGRGSHKDKRPSQTVYL